MDKPMVVDVSKWQGSINFMKMRLQGVKAVIIRASVGDYYTDPNFQLNVHNAKFAGMLVGAYYVIAPADSGGRRITADAHLKRFWESISAVKLDLPHTVDCELTRGQDNRYITSVIDRCLDLTPLVNGEGPSLYTRQSWWDPNVLPSVRWCEYRLHAARYAPDLIDPWSDGRYKFRDWIDWHVWQYSADGNGQGPAYGAESADIDLNRINGTWEDFLEWNGLSVLEPEPEPEPLTLDERVTRLERDVADLKQKLGD